MVTQTTQPRRLHIGGISPAEGWEIFNALAGEHIDHQGNALDLSRFEDNTFEALYASHVLEHFDYKDELQQVLLEWKRVLEPGGKIYISVPDMSTLAQLFLARDQLDVSQRFQVMRMMFGGHVDRYDYHMVGFDQDILVDFLAAAGFVDFVRMSEFGLFQDTSTMRYGGIPISLNVLAHKPA